MFDWIKRLFGMTVDDGVHEYDSWFVRMRAEECGGYSILAKQLAEDGDYGDLTWGGFIELNRGLHLEMAAMIEENRKRFSDDGK